MASLSPSPRDAAKLAPLCSETGARAFACDAQDEAQVQRLFGQLDREHDPPDVVIYNASVRSRGRFADLVPADVQRALQVTAFSTFLVAQQAFTRMLPKRHGAIPLPDNTAIIGVLQRYVPWARWRGDGDNLMEVIPLPAEPAVLAAAG